MKPFREWLAEQRELNEMLKYSDHHYLDFKPIDDKSMQFLEKTWQELKVYSAKIKQLDDDMKIFATKSKTVFRNC